MQTLQQVWQIRHARDWEIVRQPLQLRQQTTSPIIDKRRIRMPEIVVAVMTMAEAIALSAT
ncbi:hypothetical protein MAFF211271_07030 [Ralstonia syzygii subsp. indonesiensis]|nr:hypothetical protein MAFF211271_07030 [Ralstonia pseudosolanacearum]